MVGNCAQLGIVWPVCTDWSGIAQFGQETVEQFLHFLGHLCCCLYDRFFYYHMVHANNVHKKGYKVKP